ncbi:hypothetical protein [Sutcliffiella deserti]|uniref:hypothetical protein n=1 Tax=Sutcliffiella deserti TaxID=2875501 RepID=UPI001CC0E626|nr:hypothetical protein [Sutcliffiella deserti]
MTEIRNLYILKAIVRSLSYEKRHFYEFIEAIELSYEIQAENAEDYFSLLTMNHPYREAANHFRMSVEEARAFMLEVEEEIKRELDRTLQSILWIEFPKEAKKSSSQKKSFLLIV